MKTFIQKCSILLLLLLSSPLHAETITLSAAQLNQQLAESFPIVKSYQGVKVSFTDARVKLDVLDKTLKITTLIVAEMDGQMLSANGVLFGPLQYDDLTQAIVMFKPELEAFYMVENHMSDPDPAIRIIKQTISANLRDIVIMDTNKFDFLYQGTEPMEITISPKGLVVSL